MTNIKDQEQLDYQSHASMKKKTDLEICYSAEMMISFPEGIAIQK